MASWIEKMHDDPSHPAWKLLRLVIVGVIVVGYCATQYKNPINMADIGLLVTLLLSVGGYDKAKAVLTKGTKEDDENVQMDS